MSSNSIRSVLFLCTGNAYRSRYAEAWFNYLCIMDPRNKHTLKAFSRGLNVTCGTLDACRLGYYPETRERLLEKQIPACCTGSSTRQVEYRDFLLADLVICMYEIEHRPYIDEKFPSMSPIYWNVPDQFYAKRDCPEFEKLPRAEGFAMIEREVEKLYKNIAYTFSDYNI